MTKQEVCFALKITIFFLFLLQFIVEMCDKLCFFFIRKTHQND